MSKEGLRRILNQFVSQTGTVTAQSMARNREEKMKHLSKLEPGTECPILKNPLLMPFNYRFKQAALCSWTVVLDMVGAHESSCSKRGI